MKLLEGNIFIPVCHSVILFMGEGGYMYPSMQWAGVSVSQHEMGRDVCIPASNGWGCIPACNGGASGSRGMYTPWADTNPFSRHPILGRPPLVDTPLGRHPPTPMTATEAGATHPTGMHTCSQRKL